MTIVGERVRELRDRLGIKQKEFAKRMGLSPSYLSELERGIRRWNEEHINKAAQALAVSPGLLQDQSIDLDHLHEISAVLLLLKELPADKVAALRALVETMI